MDRIASPHELQSELRRLLAYSQSERPSREKLALEIRRLADRVSSHSSRSAGFLQDKVNGQDVTNLEPEEAAKLRQLVRSVVRGGGGSVRLDTRGSTKGWTYIKVHDGSKADYTAVLDVIDRLGYVTSVPREEHQRRIEKYDWNFPPGGIVVFKPV